jgi:hypothetical protein
MAGRRASGIRQWENPAMDYRIIRRPLALAGVLACGGLAAGCANGPLEAFNAPPPPAASAPRSYVPPQYSGSSNPEQLAVTNGARMGPGGFRTTAPLHLRSGPGDGAPVVATLPAGTPVSRNGMIEGNWWGVTTPYGPGWVYDRYLAPT